MADYFDERTKFNHRLEGLANGLGYEIAKTLEGALEKVEGKIVALAVKAEDTPSLTRKKKYLEQQRDEIERVLNEVYEAIGKDIKDKSVETAKATPEIVNSMLKKSLKIEFGVPRLSKRQVVAWFESSQIEGLFFNEWMKKLEKSAVDRILREVRESMILYESRGQAAKRIQNALDVGRHSAKAIAQTSIHQSVIFAERSLYEENLKEIRGFRHVSELDRRTTPICRELDGHIYRSFEEVSWPPLHMLCRSWIFPIYKDVGLIPGKRISRLDTAGRVVRHRDGTTSTKYEKRRVQFISKELTYNEWMTSLVNSKNPADVTFAREVLGPTRFKLVASGKLKMEKLYYHGSLRTIKQLKSLYQ